MTVRIGMAGVAHLHADAYIDNLRVAGADVVGVFDHDSVRARSWADHTGSVAYLNLDELLSEGLDGVIVCSETVYHRELVERCAAAGCAVLCEKPLGVSHDDTANILAVCEDAGVSLMTAFPTRFHPAITKLRTLVASGGLGRLRAFTGTNQSVMPLRERSWFADRALAGGGAMMDHVVHLADLFCWISGIEPQEIYAVGNRIVHSEVVGVETSGLVMMSFADGLFASIDCSWNRPLDYPSWGGMELSVVGDGGTVNLDPFRQRLTQFGGRRPYGWTSWGVDTNQLMIEEFLAAITQHRPPSVSGRDGAIATTVALLALESAATGAPVVWPGAITG